MLTPDYDIILSVYCIIDIYIPARYITYYPQIRAKILNLANQILAQLVN